MSMDRDRLEGQHVSGIHRDTIIVLEGKAPLVDGRRCFDFPGEGIA